MGAEHSPFPRTPLFPVLQSGTMDLLGPPRSKQIPCSYPISNYLIIIKVAGKISCSSSLESYFRDG